MTPPFADLTDVFLPFQLTEHTDLGAKMLTFVEFWISPVSFKSQPSNLAERTK